MDLEITRWINGTAGAFPFVDNAMIAITQFGVPLIVLATAMQWWAPGNRSHVRHTAIAAGLSFLLGLGLNQVILLFVHRVRPYDAGVTHLLIPPSADWSFPSDHSTAVMAVVAAFALQRLPGRTILFAASALLVDWSRIYVGTHYFTDVLGGALTGIIAALIVRLAYRPGTRLDRFATGLF